MRVVFADAYYYLAFVNDRDAAHVRALEVARTYRGRTITTEWVLTEVADALSAPLQRPACLELFDFLSNDATVTVVEASHDLFERGMDLYANRFDKSWSLTDCISFVAMEDRAIAEALTADRHFEQAGFKTLLD